MATSTFVDTNILMELFFRRPKYDKAVQSLMALPEQNSLTISILSLSTLMYYVEAKKIDTLQAHNFLQGYRILDMSNADYIWAKANDQGDFEDALQVGCARRHGCTQFITLDQAIGQMYGKFITVQTVT